jgi:hypothetical protein
MNSGQDIVQENRIANKRGVLSRELNINKKKRTETASGLSFKRYLVDCTTATITASPTPVNICNFHTYESGQTTFSYPTGLFTYDVACFASGTVVSATFKTGPLALPMTKTVLTFSSTTFRVDTGPGNLG